MARPRTALGTAGTINTTGLVIDSTTGDERPTKSGERATVWRARTRYRDKDGISRQIEKRAGSKARAEADLKRALAERTSAAGSGDITGRSTVAAAITLWLTHVERGDLAVRTKTQYKGDARRYVEGGTIAGLTLSELNVQAVERWLQGIADNNGEQAAKAARRIMSNMLGMAVRYGAVTSPVTREVKMPKAATPKDTVRDTSRAMTREQRDLAMSVADRVEVEGYQNADEPRRNLSPALDYADLVAFLAGTGVRIGEALGMRWDDLSDDHNSAHIRGTKTVSSDRVLALPEWLTKRLTKRRARVRGEGRSVEGLVFSSPRIKDADRPRNVRNAMRFTRVVLDEAGMPWATPHTFRRTVATLLDESAQTPRQIADHLGHANPAMTLNVYMGRKVANSQAAALL